MRDISRETSWISGYGNLHVEHGEIAKVFLTHSFSSYYLWHLNRALSLGFRTRGRGEDARGADPNFEGRGMGVVSADAPLGLPHITIARRKHNPLTDWGLMRSWAGRRVRFEYSPDIQLGGKHSNFWNFYLPVRSREIEQIKVATRTSNNKSFKGLHVTIGNTKAAKIRKPPLPDIFD